MKKIFLFIVLVMAAGAFFCSKSNDSKGNGPDIEANARATLPVLIENSQNPAPGMRVITERWGSIDFEIMVIFVDPDAWIKGGNRSLGTNNIYNNIRFISKMSEDTDFDSCKGKAVESITYLPFFDTHSSGTFFDPAFGKNYTCWQDWSDYNADFASNKAGPVYDLLYVTEGGGGAASSSSSQVKFDEDSKNIAYRIAGFHTAGAKFYTMRFEFKGNAETHQFTIRLTKNNLDATFNDSGYQIRMVGTGVSQGSGNHFLMKVKDNATSPGDESAWDVMNAKYFCYDADAKTVADVSANVAGSACGSYKADVDALEFFRSTTDLARNTFDMSLF